MTSKEIDSTQSHNSVAGEWNDSLKGDFLWTKTNFGEAITETMTPLSWSVSEFTFSGLAYLPGFPSLGNIGGFPYYNLTSLATALRTIGFNRKRMLGMIEDLLNVRLPDEVEIPLVPFPRWKLIFIPYRIAYLLSRFKQGIRDASWYLATNREWFARTREKIIQEKNPAGLVKLWQDEIQTHIIRGFWSVLGTADDSGDATFSLRRKLLPLVGPDDANTLISNLNNDNDMLVSLGPVVGLSKVASGELTRDTYLAQFGHRGPNEFEISLPRPVENPAWIEQELARLKKDPVNIHDLLNRQKESFEAAWSRFASRYPNRVKSMQRALTRSARLARLREQVRSEYVRDRWLMRLFAVRAGELTGIGDDIFFLMLNEVLDALAGDLTVTSFIPSRKEMYQRLKVLPSFPIIIRGQFDPFQWAEDPHRRSDIFDATSAITKKHSTVIKGSPGSSGKVEGVIRVIDDPKNGDQLKPGEILVAVQTDISWTLLFPRLAAIVTDVGAPLSHAAIVARELGIPAVVGCGNATMLLKTGDRVRVDGGAGTVEIL